jgi:hypothetical protein
MVERAERYAEPIARTVLWIALAALLLLAGVSLTFAIAYILLGAGIAIIGVAGKRSKVRAVVWASTFIRRRRFTWVVAAMFGFAGSVGSGVHWARASEQAALCTQQRDSATASIASNQFYDARTWLERARANCTETANIDATIADVGRQEKAYNQARATEAAARNALAAAAIEKQAVDGFPALSKTVTDTLRTASVKMAQGQWAEAEKFRASARTALDGEKGTSVTTTKEWLDLSAKVDALQQKLQPQLDRIAQAEAARDRQHAAAQERAQQQAARSQERETFNSLLSEYKDNEVRADATYKGRVVDISGIVTEIGTSVLGGIHVVVGHGWEFELPQVQCFFDDRLGSSVAQISKGQTVRLRGRVIGLTINVLLKDCQFIE